MNLVLTLRQTLFGVFLCYGVSNGRNFCKNGTL